MNIQKIKEQITSDGVILIMTALGVDYNFISHKEIHFRSVCHNSDSYKLYYYEKSKKFFCFVDNQSWDIFSIVQKISNINFIDSVKFICKTLGLNIEDENKSNIEIDSWQSLKRYLPDGDTQSVELPIYNQSVLSLFNPYYPQDWLDYGIKKEIMDKFNIGWYSRLSCISIPVFFNGDLVGIRGRFTKERDCANGKYKPITALDGTVYKFPTNQLCYGYDQNKDAISKSKTAFLFESEKSVLKAPSYGINNALAVFGSNISKRHIELLLELGVNNIILCFDSDYKTMGNNDEFNFFVAKMKRIISKLSPYFSVELVYNNQGYDMYKSNIMDMPYNQAMKLYESRVKIK